MKKLLLVIKGKNTESEARKRGFQIHSKICPTNREETIVIASGTYTQANSWMMEEPRNAPYPDGSLLFYRESAGI